MAFHYPKLRNCNVWLSMGLMAISFQGVKLKLDVSQQYVGSTFLLKSKHACGIAYLRNIAYFRFLIIRFCINLCVRKENTASPWLIVNRFCLNCTLLNSFETALSITELFLFEVHQDQTAENIYSDPDLPHLSLCSVQRANYLKRSNEFD